MPTSYTYEQCILYEVLREAINACCGAYLCRIHKERKQTKPDRTKISLCMEEVKRLIQMRDTIIVTDVKLITNEVERFSRLHVELSAENALSA